MIRMHCAGCLKGVDMRAISRLPAFLVLLALGMAGCTIAQRGETVVKHDKGSAPIMGEAVMDGQYALYKALDGTPRVTYNLKQGDKLGFDRNDDGQLIAVAGSNRVPVPNDGYYWRRR